MNYLHNIPRIYEALEDLCRNDPVFKTYRIDINKFQWPYYGTGFASLVRIVIGQQISTQAAKSLWQKFEEGLPCITPNAILILKNDEMRALGVSHQKASYIRTLAEEIKEGRFDPHALERQSNEEVVEAITSMKGFGQWSADMYLMFGMARPDVFPAGDLGIRKGMQRYLGLDKIPDENKTKEEGTRFAPNRTAASLLFWSLKEDKSR